MPVREQATETAAASQALAFFICYEVLKRHPKHYIVLAKHHRQKMPAFQFLQRAPATCLWCRSKSACVFPAYLVVMKHPPTIAHYVCKTSPPINARFPVPAACIRDMFAVSAKSAYVFPAYFVVLKFPLTTAHYVCKTSPPIGARFPVPTACVGNIFAGPQQIRPCTFPFTLICSNALAKQYIVMAKHHRQ